MSAVYSVTFDAPGKGSLGEAEGDVRLMASTRSTCWWERVLLTVLLNQMSLS